MFFRELKRIGAAVGIILSSPSRDASFYRVAYDAINFIAPAGLPACKRLDFHYRRDTPTIK